MKDILTAGTWSFRVGFKDYLRYLVQRGPGRLLTDQSSYLIDDDYTELSASRKFHNDWTVHVYNIPRLFFPRGDSILAWDGQMVILQDKEYEYYRMLLAAHEWEKALLFNWLPNLDHSTSIVWVLYIPARSRVNFHSKTILSCKTWTF